MITGACHCGAISYTFDDDPDRAVSCNCSIGRRLGTLWIYAQSTEIQITGTGDTIAYTHGDENLAFHTCKSCGCTTHWENLKVPEGKMAVNLQLADLDVIAKVPIRRFDGADTWQFLDD